MKKTLILNIKKFQIIKKMGNLSCCKCLSKNLTFFASDPNLSQLNPAGSNETLELIKNKNFEENTPNNSKVKAATILPSDFKIEKVMKIIRFSNKNTRFWARDPLEK